jgi:hypothetical protein
LLTDNLAGTTLWVQGSNAGGHALLTIPASQTNHGILRLETTGGGGGFFWNSNVVIASGNLTNAADGILAVNLGTGGGRTLAGELINNGTLQINTSLTLGAATAHSVNTGTIRFGGNSTFTVLGDGANPLTPAFLNQASGTIALTGPSSVTIDVSNSNLENLGLFDVPALNTLVIKGQGSFLNFNKINTTLIDGSYHVAGTFSFDDANIVSLSADLELTDSRAQVLNSLNNANALLGLTTLTGGAHPGILVISSQLANTAGNLTNNGTLTVRGQMTVTGNYVQTGTLNVLNGTVKINGAFSNYDPAKNTLSGGTFVIAGTPDLPGTLRFGNNTFSANLITNAANLTLDGPGAQILDNNTANNALANFAVNTGALTLQNGYSLSVGPFTNSGTVMVGKGSTLTVNGNDTDSGTFSILAGGTFNLLGGGNSTGTLSNAGTLTVGGGKTFTVANGYSQTGAVTIQAGAGLVLNGGGTASGTITNAGSLTVDGGKTLTVPGVYSQTGTLSIPQGAALILNGGGDASGTITNAGTLAVGSGATFTVAAAYSQTGTLQVPSGAKMILTGPFPNFAGGTLTGGSYQIGGTFQFANAAIVTNAADLTLAGPNAKITDLNGLDALGPSLTLNAATGHLSLLDGAIFSSAGKFENDGLLTIGVGSTFTVNSDFTQGSAGILEFQLGGTAAGQFGTLAVKGTANLAGTLRATPVKGYVPASGDVLKVMTFNSRTGDFAKGPTGFGRAFNDVTGSLSLLVP